MGNASGKLALPPAGQEFLVHGQEVPPGGENAIGVCLQVGAPRGQVEVRHVGAVAVEQHDLFEAVVGERPGDVQDLANKGLVVSVDGAGEVHDMAGVAVPHGRQDEHLVGNLAAGPVGDAQRADDVDIERQVRSMLLHGAAGHDAHLAHLDGVVDLRPG